MGQHRAESTATWEKIYRSAVDPPCLGQPAATSAADG